MLDFKRSLRYCLLEKHKGGMEMASISCRENKNGIVYRIQVKVKDNGNGKYIVRSMTWEPPESLSNKQAEREVIVVAKEYEDKIKKQLDCCVKNTNDDKITFKEFAETWLEKCKQENSASYYVSSSRAIETANNYIGGYKLVDLTPRIIQNFYDKIDKFKMNKVIVTPKENKIRERMAKLNLSYTDVAKKSGKGMLTAALAGSNVKENSAKTISKALGTTVNSLFDVKKESKPYAHETIHRIKRTVRAILAVAKRQRLIQDNWASADYIEFPKKPKVEIEFLDDADAKKLYMALQKSNDIRHKTALMTLLLTGLRRGELCGLEWDDIDFKQGTLTVERSVTTVKGFGVIEKDPKTESSKRTMSLPESLIQQLKEYKEWQAELAKSLGDRWVNTGRIFTAEFGDKIHPSVVMGWLKKVCADNNLPRVTLHSLRHTNITLQIMAGVPLVIVSGRAGHARTSTTTDVYSHFLKSSDKEAAEKLNNLFG